VKKEEEEKLLMMWKFQKQKKIRNKLPKIENILKCVYEEKRSIEITKLWRSERYIDIKIKSTKES
jgi:hypothetical protein